MMKNKKKILAITVVLTIIVFGISTYLQRQLVDYEPKVVCLVVNRDIEAYEKVDEGMVAYKEVPISLVATSPIVARFDDIKDLYAKDCIKKNQIIMKSQFDTKENLAIYEAENGKEKISIKIQNAENGISYTIRQNSLINVYITVRSDYAQEILKEKDGYVVGNEYDGYAVVKLLENVKVLGAFNIDGLEVNSFNDGIIDTILVAVTPDEAKKINLFRDIASFNVTGITNYDEAEESMEEDEAIDNSFEQVDVVDKQMQTS